MDDDQELLRLENEWKDRFDRFTSPEPSREETLRLLEKIKASEETKPIDLRSVLEESLASQTIREKIVNQFLSQWNFHGATSWLFTIIVMLILTISVSQNIVNEMTGFVIWVKSVTLIMIAVTCYAFRSKNEGNQMIEMLSYYPLVEQMFTRFLIVLGLQLATALPLSFFIMGKSGSLLSIISVFTPLFFFGVVGFVSTMWLGQKLGVSITLIVWSFQVLADKQLKFFSLFQLMENEQFVWINVIVLAVSILLLSSIRLKKRQLEH